MNLNIDFSALIKKIMFGMNVTIIRPATEATGLIDELITNYSNDNKYEFIRIKFNPGHTLAEATTLIISMIEPIINDKTMLNEYKNYWKSAETDYDYIDVIGYTLELLDQAAIDAKIKYIVIFENFNLLLKYDKQIFRTMRSVIQLQKHVRYIYTGWPAEDMAKIFFDPKAPFFRSTDNI